MIESSARASFRINELGYKALTENPEIVDHNYLKNFEGFQDFINSTSYNILLDVDISDIGRDESLQDLLDRVYKTISNTLANDLLTEDMNLPRIFLKNSW